MFVIKRDGRKQPVHFDKITARIQTLCYGLDMDHVDPAEVAAKVIEGLHDGISTSQLDILAAEVAAMMTIRHPDYALLAARIAISNLQKNTLPSFSETIQQLYHYQDVKTGQPAALISKELYDIVQQHHYQLDAAIVHERDFSYDYFGFKTLEHGYLLKMADKTAERPQYMIMRVALGIHGNDIAAALETYTLMSERWFTHATPTLFNAGTPRPQMSSCFLLTMKEDSIDGIFETLADCAKISQSAGGIGLSIHNIRAAGSYIKGTGGTSNGIVPMLRVFNDTARYVDQGGGKRKGSFAIYLEPWHADIMSFLDLRKNTGKEELRARDLFLALWIPDLFMQRVRDGSTWSLFCPNEAPELHTCYGDAFTELYTRYEQEGRARKTIKAQDLWMKICEAQIETGTPYMVYKDACNTKSNHKHLGTISCSNLCAEIVEYTAPDEIAVCNLASLSLPRYIHDGSFDHEQLYTMTKVVTKNLNRIIDRNYYPVESARRSNMRHRPIGIGVQGLADVFITLRYTFDSEEARALNKEIFETIYYAALTASMELAQEEGPYVSYEGSPLSQGLLQPDLWGVQPSDRWDWHQLRADIQAHGIRNSLLIALMPTASTSQILGNTEGIEPYTSNIYSRRVLSGEFIVVNSHLLRDLIKVDLWDTAMKNAIIAANGSIQSIPSIPQEIKDLYKTVWEIKQKTLIDLAADRSPFICQSQSLNIFMENPTLAKLSSMHFYGWQRGLKTGMYYLRTKAAAEAIKFTVEKAAPTCSLGGGCTSCGS